MFVAEKPFQCLFIFLATGCYGWLVEFTCDPAVGIIRVPGDDDTGRTAKLPYRPQVVSCVVIGAAYFRVSIHFENSATSL
jgi:hypothetical protein